MTNTQEGNGGEKPLSWYQRNKESICAKYRQEYADNTNGKKDRVKDISRASYERTKHTRKLSDEQKARKKRIPTPVV